MYTTVRSPGILRIICSACGGDCDPGAKFCCDCGSVIDYHTAAPQAAAPLPGQTHEPVPTFAPVSPRHVRAPNNEQRAEAARLMILLARERLFLYFHWLGFLVVNIVGFWIACKCYNEYLGDDLTKLMIGMTPLLYINCLALLFIIPICGTKKEIARLKERLNYVRFQIEYSHLI